MAKGYVAAPVGTAAGNLLGKTLTTPQANQATFLADFAEQYIDRRTLRGWITPPITNERYDLLEDRLFLKSVPIASVQGITQRTTQIGCPLYTMLAGTDYEILDAARGQIDFIGGYSGPTSLVFVSYTPANPVPADISWAATLIIAYNLMLQFFPDRLGISAATLDQHTKLEYTSGDVTLAIPALAADIVDGYRRKPLII